MKIYNVIFLLFLASQSISGEASGQNSTQEVSSPAKSPDNKSVLYATAAGRRENNIIAITGVRFAYPLVQQWIDEYNALHPDIQIIIESRGSNDPATYDILIEAYEPDNETKNKRYYIYIARYAILPVANSQSGFSKAYAIKGLNQTLIKQLFFHDIYADKKDKATIKEPFTVYTRLQKAGAPITFSKYFGYQQKDIKGKFIAGSDEHLLKAVLRDTIGVTYLPLNLVYDQKAGTLLPGLAILPVDLNGNNKVGEDEKFYSHFATVIQRLEENTQQEIKNIPMEYLNLSVDKNNSNPEAIKFLQWIIEHGQKNLHAFGFLLPEPSRLEQEKQQEFMLKGKE
jgi:phosphate transport system substrate-binding protein